MKRRSDIDVAHLIALHKPTNKTFCSITTPIPPRGRRCWLPFSFLLTPIKSDLFLGRGIMRRFQKISWNNPYPKNARTRALGITTGGTNQPFIGPLHYHGPEGQVPEG